MIRPEGSFREGAGILLKSPYLYENKHVYLRYQKRDAIESFVRSLSLTESILVERSADKQSFRPGSGHSASSSKAIDIPKVSLPKGGGALKSIDEKFAVNAANGTASFSLPLPFSKSRSSFGPGMTLAYNSGSGNSPFGLGWSADVGSIQRRSDKKLPAYRDDSESDVFQLAGIEDLVPRLEQVGVNWQPVRSPDGLVREYRPRIEGSFARIERIQLAGTGIFYWKIISRDNVTTVYGRSAEARIADPADPARIFRWLPELSYDDQGNCLEYEYKPEDSSNVPFLVHEKNRHNGLQPFTNRYLKRIRHGNRTPYFPDPSQPYTPAPPVGTYFFDVVFDYGEHDENNPDPAQEPNRWACRWEPFSDNHAGFEVRTYRLCRRILFFHSFEELSAPGTITPCLVRSVDLTYQHFKFDNAPYVPQEADFITAIRQYGYERAGAHYERSTLPPIEFTYNELRWNSHVQLVSRADAPNLPTGLTSGYQWTDFYGEGIAGVLSEQAGGWYYAANQGNGRFAPARVIAPRPSFSGLGTGSLQIQDIEANGKKYIVSLTGDTKGFFEQTDDGDWLPFRAFERFPTVSPTDPFAKWIDLNGDGMPELVVAEDQVFVWYESLGRMGYDAPEYRPKPFDEDRGPAVVFADELQRIYTTDMSGDGLSDIVRIRNGEICYWPNMGYGRFGAKVTMSNAPVFDTPDGFNPAYLHVTEVSGTGAADLLYVGRNRVVAYLNLSGNAWSDGQRIDPFPTVEAPNQITVCDFTGNGTGSLVWSSPEPANADAPLRYIDLMGGNKPYIMTQYRNNFGKTVSITFRSSTRFYLDDKAAGTPWRTKLPFPVQCVSQVEHHDAVTNLRLINQYSYHHGYYDHAEREFRGFGRVEQRDTERFDNWVRQDASNLVNQEMHEPVVLTKTWYHTGAFLDRERILTQFETEYWYNTIRQLDASLVVTEHQLPDARLPQGLTDQAYREALRACKGMTLRQEVFALDAPDNPSLAEQLRQATPYSVSTHNAQIQALQPQGTNAHAVFLLHESESIQFHYERQPDDPRIAHNLNTVIDELGHVRESASVVYGRQQVPAGSSAVVRNAQEALHITYTVSDYTNDVIEPAAYRLRQVCCARTDELTGVVPANHFFEPDELRLAFAGAGEIAYHETANPAHQQRRNIEHTRTLYRSNDTTQPLPLGQLQALGLTYETYQLAFSQALIDSVFGARVNEAMLQEGHYLRSFLYKPASPDPATQGLFPASDPDNDWWIPSGQSLYPANPAQHFYQPDQYRDPAGQLTTVRYWRDYQLLISETEDALGNKMVIEEVDFRFMLPQQVLDANQNRSAVRYDRLGLVAGSALMGKGNEGDDFVGFRADLTQAEVDAFFADPEATAATLLQHATSRFVYDLTLFHTVGQPAVVASVGRETHHHESQQTGTPSPLQIGFEYTSGMGQVIMKKVQVEPGLARQLLAQPDGSITVVDVDTSPRLRWVGNGRTIFNNKGKPIRTYEPYFSVTHRFENARELVEVGVSNVLFYDSIGRLIRTDHPNQTVARQEIGAWQQRAFDENDTVVGSGWYTARIGGALGPQEQQAAQQAAVHDNTPTETVFDSLGRAFLNRIQNRYLDPVTNAVVTDPPYETLITFDIEGNQRSVTDARGNVVMEYQYDRLGHPIFQHSMDAGDHRTLNDCMGKTLYGWDAEDRRFQSQYDALHRPIAQIVRFPDNSETVFDRSEYGTSSAADMALNRNLKLVRHYDGAGRIEHLRFDFRDNTLETTRQFVDDHRVTPDWTTPDSVVFQPQVFQSQTTFDALNRPVILTLPEGSRIEPGYNQSNLLITVAATINANPRQFYVEHIDYDAKGQRQRIDYGNHTFTTYSHDPLTFRLSRMRTIRTVDEAGNAANELLQDLAYTYDPVGNITSLVDSAQQTLFYNGAVVEPSQAFVYDALYRLINATGREHAAQQQPASEFDQFRTNLIHKGDGLALQNYAQRYEYDAVGNMLRMIHRAGRGALQNRWTRSLTYDGTNNHLLSSEVGGVVSNYTYDIGGNMRSMPHLPAMSWDFEDQLHQLDLGGGGTAYYQYDAEGQRVRKVVERPGGLVQERLYIGHCEVYTETQAGAIALRRESIHVMDDSRRLALVETRTDTNSAPLIRFQYGNHLGTASLELDEGARIISYEEYYPFGSSSYQAGRSQAEVAQKRYRYTGKERDEESGFYYHGARYYAPWLARWTKADPIGLKDGVNRYTYVRGNPIKYSDPTGTSSWWQRNSHYVIGSLQVVGGALEVAAGAAGLAAPTGVTQVLGGVAVVHGADTLTTGLHTLISGRPQETLTQQAAAGGARALGASEQTARRIGIGVDIAVGLGTGVGLARSAATTTARATAEGVVETTAQTAPRVATRSAATAAPSLATRAAPATTRAAARAFTPTVQIPKGISTSWVFDAADLARRAGRPGAGVQGLAHPGIRLTPYANRFLRAIPGLRRPVLQPYVELLGTLNRPQLAAVTAHEGQHVIDFLRFPQLSYLALASRVPGRGLANLALELRGYHAQLGVWSIGRAWGSMGSVSRGFLVGEVGAASVGVGAGISYGLSRPTTPPQQRPNP